MTIREEKIERYEEALFILWADEVALQEGRDLERENAALHLDANFRAPEEVVRRGRELISRKLAARTARSVGRRAWKFVHTAALVCLFTTLAFSAAFAASPSFRANTLNLVIETFDEGTRFQFTSSNDINDFDISWLPEKFILKNQNHNNLKVWKEYESPSEAYISVYLAKGVGTTHDLDTEDATVDNIEIQGIPSIIATKENCVQILLTPKETNYFIQITSSGVSKEEIICVAENIIF